MMLLYLWYKKGSKLCSVTLYSIMSIYSSTCFKDLLRNRGRPGIGQHMYHYVINRAIVRGDIGLIFCLTTQQDTVVTTVGASQAHINNSLENINRNILKRTGKILYHKQHNEIDSNLLM